jgi:hypothetical protein
MDPRWKCDVLACGCRGFRETRKGGRAAPIGPADVTDRANALAFELRRIAYAHMDSITDADDRGAIEIMALAVALADVVLDARASVGRPFTSPREVERALLSAPFRTAAEVAMHPQRPRP